MLQTDGVVKADLWAMELLKSLCGASSEDEILPRIASAACSMGFDYFSYGIKHLTGDGHVAVKIMNNLPPNWEERYRQANYLFVDPTVMHCQVHQTPIVWSDRIFESTPALWSEANSAGLRAGWARSIRDVNGLHGMLTIARNERHIGASELKERTARFQWLLNACQLLLNPVLINQSVVNSYPQSSERILTTREKEILEWTAEGKTSSSISDTLHISEATVNFHIRNVLKKLNVTNKTAAAVQAVRLGLID
ncbi:autoinducer binding domain-containing protein [Aquabacterium sp.]|uniref:autoinducer binding domain-containing protein n=1 Tax=Aquabacterium sp. TaxID=1872578 RepID=UPI0040384CE4